MSPRSSQRRVIVTGMPVSHAPLPQGAPTPSPGAPRTAPPGPVQPPAQAAPALSATRLAQMRQDAQARTQDVLRRAQVVHDAAADLRVRDLEGLDAQTTALQQRIEGERRARRAQADQAAQAEWQAASTALRSLVTELAPGVAGSPLGAGTQADASTQADPARFLRVGTARIPQDAPAGPSGPTVSTSPASPAVSPSPAGPARSPGPARDGAVGEATAESVAALAPFLCRSHWHLSGSTRQAQELVLSALTRVIGQVPLKHLRVLVFDPRVTGVVGPLSPLRAASGTSFPPPVADPGALVAALRQALEATTQNAERIAVAGARDLLDLWRREGEASGVLTVVVLLDHPYCVDDQLSRVLKQVAAMSPASGLHLVVQSDPAYGPPQVPPGPWLALCAQDGCWQVPGLPGSVRVAHDGAPALDAVEHVIRQAVQRSRSVTGPRIPLVELIGDDMERPWTGSSRDSLEAVVGRVGREPLVLSLRTENPPHPNLLIGGAVGQGKSNLLLDIVYSLAVRYPPEELTMLLLDYKRGLEFARFAPDEDGQNWLPHVSVLSLESDQEFGVAVLDYVRQELERRSELFKDAGASSIVAYRRTTGEVMPRMLVIIDEFHVMFEGDDDLVDQAVAITETIAKQGRAYGIHLLLASQTVSGISGLRAKGDSIFAQFPLRMSLKNTAQESEAILSQHNRAAAELTYRGEVVLNRNFGHDPAGSNVRGTAAWAQSEVMAVLQQGLWSRGHAAPPLVFLGAEEARWPTAHLERLRGTGAPSAPRLWLGRPVAVSDVPSVLELDTDVDQGVVLVGSGEELAGAVMGSAVLTALATTPQEASLLVLTGLDQLPGRLEAAVDAWRQAGRGVRVVGRTEVARVLVEEVAPLLADGAPHPMLVVGVGLQRVVGMSRPYQAPATALADSAGTAADSALADSAAGASGTAPGPGTAALGPGTTAPGSGDLAAPSPAVDLLGPADAVEPDWDALAAGIDLGAGGWEGAGAGALGLAPEPVTPASVLQRVFTDGGLQQVFALGWWTTLRAMGRDLGQYQRPGVRATVLLRLGLADLRELTGPHTKPLGRGPRVGLLDHASDAEMQVLVPLAAPDASVVAQLAGQGARGPGQGAVQDAGGPDQGAGQPSPVGTQRPGGQEDVA
ncbi:FtsK/SpoIIIE domain-containing protein [uncultured Actinomyces sp.]|uniref:FtsK/SpoIIIE domain-containing protein n=1 Tax=uncultured Actinomyces sp. TaxID=249061 RepID=UPI0028E5C49C|nr:FtsK/SpoIIIE domain-containing protein [uncultured Actinomyces sp.]